MSCQEAFFAGAHCRIDIAEKDEGVGGSAKFLATASVVDDVAHQVRPLIFPDGSRIAVAGSSEAVAFNSMLSYLEGRFGSYSEIAYGCIAHDQPESVGEPLVIEAAEVETL